ncbi:MAG: P1 family peptidase [Candidatus Onthomonas sp.]|nr:P1 family peptidase [Candidatus Onthomonas sp.]
MCCNQEGMCWEGISITDLAGVKIGNAQDEDAMTGVTVFLFDPPSIGGVDVSGGGPASRESQLLAPLTNQVPVNALVLSGGSAFGLDASGGVMRYLEERGKGLPVLGTVVPLVCQSCIFDLGIGSVSGRPDGEMGYRACVDAERNQPVSGIAGAGTGATVGKGNGIAQGQKSGIGYYAVQLGELKVGAVAVVNAFGDIYDPRTGQKIAGMMNPERTAFVSCEAALCQSQQAGASGANTTLGAVFTNGAFDQAAMNKIASMARAAFGRCIRPSGTMIDGDTIYAFSVGEQVEADINAVGTLAAAVLSEAIRDAVSSSVMPEAEFLRKIGK